MRIVCRTLWLPKKGNTQEEYEDAASPLDDVEEESSTFKCAVADGATETSFSGFWAKLLADGYVSGANRDELKVRWQDSLETKELPWYAEQKAESGAFAALLGLSLQDGESGDSGTWEAEAVGDCCLFLVRDGNVIEKFPLNESEQFNSSPVLLSSNNDEAAAEAEKQVLKATGEWKRGDVFYLMTDAIARWSYKRQEEYGDVSHWLKSMSSQKELEEFTEVQRTITDAENRPLMRNDDVTLMTLQIL